MNAHVTALIQAIRDAVVGFDVAAILTSVNNIESDVAAMETSLSNVEVYQAAIEPDIDALNAKTVGPGTWTPATVAAAADEGIISAAPTTVRSFMVANSGSNDSYIQVFDSATVPGDGTAPRIPSVLLPAGQTAVVQLGALSCANGFSWASSSTADTKTVTAFAEVQLSAEIG